MKNMVKMNFKKIVFLLSACLIMTSINAQEKTDDAVLSDSTLKVFSVEELVTLRKLLARERDKLIKTQEKRREQGVEVSQEFLDATSEENANQDKILIRVGEYYIEEANNSFLQAMEQYEAAYDEYEKQLEAFNRGELKIQPEPPELPRRNYEKAIAIYDLIIQNFPESDLVGDAYYNKAYLLKDMGESQAAQQIFLKIIDLYPESSFAAEAYINLAEGYFIPEPDDTKEETIVKLNKSIQLYQNVMNFKDSPRYLESLYKLGWTYYRLAGEDPDYYTDAIIYFVAVVRDIERMQDLDPTGELVRADVKPEALDFIAASFVDPSYDRGGVQNAANFIVKLGKPEFGIKILENMGDRYAKITLWNNGINAFDQLLNNYPDYAYAPQIQKKIADAYLADGKFDQAFNARKELFENYNPKSEWYAALEQQETVDRINALDEAYRITEEALRTNIYYLNNLAQEAEEETPQEALSMYESLVEYCRFYLENYPTDENAYEIHWAMALILDSKLNRFEEAFEDYIRVSNDYLEASHRFDAAVNAIAVADTLVSMARLTTDTTRLENVEFSKLPPQDLIPEEKLLAEAYDNFIKLFPDNSETPKVLADAGALYYEHRQFDLARKYYKTMVTKFPEAQQKNIGLISLMNSYFFLGQYLDAEIVARKVLETPEIPQEQVEIARSRVGESIFKNAEKLEQQGEFLAAAREYELVYTDAGDFVDFVDIALFKSANNYEKTGEWMKAIQTYESLIEVFPESQYVLPSLGNIAEDYKELEDFNNVAHSLERISDRFPGTEDAERALYNASIFYAKAENWEEAIRINNRYIQNYPANPESKDLLFENAKFYLKLGNLVSANSIYEDFAAKYPDDPRTIEAFYQRGDYFYEREQYDLAKIEFNKAIQKSEAFARSGRDPNLYYAAESYFKLGEILYREYKAIRLTYPPNVLRERLVQKKNKLDEVQNAFTRVIEFGSLRSFEALYKVAEAYEFFANAIAEQALLPNLSREQLLVERDRVFKASVPAYERAVEEYKNVVTNLPTLADKLGISLFDTTEVTLTVADTSKLYEKKVEVDSSRDVALKWYERAKANISLILYTVAERSADFIDEYLRTPSPFSDIRHFAYQDRLLKQLVAPAVQTTINAHLKNITDSQDMNLENKYVIESKRKVLLTSNVIAEQYSILFRDAVDLYRNSLSNLEELIERGEGATNAEGMDFYDYQDYLMQIIFYLNEFSKTAVSQYRNTLQFAEDHNIENDAKLTTEEKMFNFAYESGEIMDRISELAVERSGKYLALYDSTFSPKYQLGSAFFDDQTAELRTYSKNVLEVAFNVGKDLAVENIWTRLITAKLAELDPSTYLADLPKEEFVIESDSTWLVSDVYEPGWNTVDFNDASWKNAVVVDLPLSLSFDVFDSLLVSPGPIWISIPAKATAESQKIIKGLSLEMEEKDFTLEDTSTAALADSALQAETENVDTSLIAASDSDTVTVYFRKTFQMPSRPIEGFIAVTAENQYRIFLNNEYIIGVDAADYENVRLIPFEAISQILHEEENLIAAQVTDVDGAPRLGLRFYLNSKLLPTEISDTIARIKSVQQENIAPEVLRRIVILNKNRVVTQ